MRYGRSLVVFTDGSDAAVKTGWRGLDMVMTAEMFIVGRRDTRKIRTLHMGHSMVGIVVDIVVNISFNIQSWAVECGKVFVILDLGTSESEVHTVTVEIGVGVRNLLIVPGEFEEGVYVNDRVGLEFVGEGTFKPLEDASSNAHLGQLLWAHGNGKREGLGVVSCRGCVLRCVDATGDAIFVEELGAGTGVGEG
jgi:hypothetical protein